MTPLFKSQLLMVAAVLVSLLLISLPQRTMSAPHTPANGIRSWNDYVAIFKPKVELREAVEVACAPGRPDRDLCERCAKVTRSELVYPLCCAQEGDVRQFCVNYLDFVIEESF